MTKKQTSRRRGQGEPRREDRHPGPQDAPAVAPEPPRGIVAVVGRPNVGKSALFNRLTGRRISIVHDQPGVTRDRITAIARTRHFAYELIDTGGIGSQIDDSFDAQVHTEADIAIASADIILLVVDAREGLTPVDRALASRLRRSGRPVVVVANKIDHDNHDPLAAEATALGFSRVLATSAAHGRGIAALQDIIDLHLQQLPNPEQELSNLAAGSGPGIAIVGRPNVGKSSLVNALLRSKRTIVSEVSGTTRDAVDIPFQVRGSNYTLIDTAGIRPKGRRRTSVEALAVIRSEKSIQRADLCVLVLDAAEGVTTQDKRIAGLIQKAGKPCVIVLNKWDLVEDPLLAKDVKLQALDTIRRDLFFLDYAPAVCLSARTGNHVSRLFKVIKSVQTASSARIPTAAVNRALRELIESNPPPLRKGKRLKILYATQQSPPGIIPTPSFIVFVNDPDLAPPNYLKFLDRHLREIEPFPGLPIHLEFRGRERRYAGQ